MRLVSDAPHISADNRVGGASAEGPLSSSSSIRVLVLEQWTRTTNGQVASAVGAIWHPTETCQGGDPWWFPSTFCQI
jgi:hypothetical protein